MSIDYQFKYMPLVGKLSGKSMAEQTETAINEIAQIVNENTAQAEIINTLAEEANTNSAEALEKADEALTTSSRVYITAGQVVDLDDYCESQLIYIDKTASSHLPVASKGFLEVKTNDDKTEATQVFIDDTNKEVYTRSGAITATTVGDVTTYSATYSAWNKAASTNYVENMTLIRQNSTAYVVGDIARSTSLASYMLLECTSAGTTGASEPSFAGVSVGSVVSDGSLSWTIIQFAKTDSPAFTGNPTAPTQSTTDDSTKIANTEYVKDCVPASIGSNTIPTYTNASGVVTASNASVGSSSTPMYMDNGEFKAISDTVGSGVKPTYLNAGGITASSSTVGDTDTPVYMKDGEITSIGSTLFDKIVTHLASATATSISSLNTSSLFYRMLSWALTAAGVQYNFTNSSAWYICLGSLFGGLIIQGGIRQMETGQSQQEFAFPITFNTTLLIMAGCMSTTNTYAMSSYFVSTSAARVRCSNAGELVRWLAMG